MLMILDWDILLVIFPSADDLFQIIDIGYGVQSHLRPKVQGKQCTLGSLVLRASWASPRKLWLKKMTYHT